MMADPAARTVVEWMTSSCPVAYVAALDAMEARVAGILAGTEREAVWLLEHPPLYTAGTSAQPKDLRSNVLPVHVTGRGGQYTYHGPGQRIAYVMLDLRRRRPDVRAFVEAVEDWVIATLARFNQRAEKRPGRVGVWVARPDKPSGLDGSPAEDKIAAIGLRLRRWVSFHGVSINVDPDLSHYAGIVPCGIAEQHLGVTSLVDLGYPMTLADLDVALRASFEAAFGPTVTAPAPA